MEYCGNSDLKLDIATGTGRYLHNKGQIFRSLYVNKVAIYALT